MYRVAPYVITSGDLVRIHGDNERIAIDNFKGMVNFYYRLVKNFQQPLPL